MEYHYSLNAIWRIEPISTRALGERFVRMVEAVVDAVPEIGPLQFAKPPYDGSHLTIDEVRADPAAWVESNPAMMDHRPDPEAGYSLIAMKSAYPSPQNVDISARIGGRLGEMINLWVGAPLVPSDLETATYPLFRSVMLAIVAQFPPVWANAKLYLPPFANTSLVPGVLPPPSTGFHRSWLGYLCEPLTRGLIPPVGVPCERTPDGGLLMIAAEERLDPYNADHMRRSRAIAEIMIARAGDPPRSGYWPLDEEWPPTPEARRRLGTDKPPPDE